MGHCCVHFAFLFTLNTLNAAARTKAKLYAAQWAKPPQHVHPAAVPQALAPARASNSLCERYYKNFSSEHE